MKYKLNLPAKADVSAPSITGALIAPSGATSGVVLASPAPEFRAWQPSTWPPAPAAVDEDFINTLKRIFEESILGEINNVIEDAKGRTGGLEHRGHVVAIACLCALDAISSYGYGALCGKQIPDFMRAHFPREYHQHADAILVLYRHAMIHSWNLFEVSITPGSEGIREDRGTISFGLLNLYEALVLATEDFLDNVLNNKMLRENALARYAELRNSAKP